MDVAIEIATEAHVETGEKWAREPKVVALTLLCRTLGNMKGAVSLLKQRQLIEAQVLARCCAENLICMGALRDKGDAFVEELLHAHSASIKKQANLVIDAYAENVEHAAKTLRLRDFLKALDKRCPKPRSLSTKRLSENNPVGSSYVMFSVLSEQAVHVSIKSLGRHLGRDFDDGMIYLRVDIAPETTDEQLVAVLQDLLAIVLGVIVGANEIVGGTRSGGHLNALMVELEAIRDEKK